MTYILNSSLSSTLGLLWTGMERDVLKKTVVICPLLDHTEQYFSYPELISSSTISLLSIFTLAVKLLKSYLHPLTPFLPFQFGLYFKSTDTVRDNYKCCTKLTVNT